MTALLTGYNSHSLTFLDSLVNFNAESKDLRPFATKIHDCSEFIAVDSDEAKGLIKEDIPYCVAFEDSEDWLRRR